MFDSIILKKPAFALAPKPKVISAALIYGEGVEFCHSRKHPKLKSHPLWNKQLQQLIQKIRVFCTQNKILVTVGVSKNSTDFLEGLEGRLAIDGKYQKVHAYDKQPDVFFAEIKYNLELIYFRLIEDNEISLQNKIKIIIELLPSFILCPAGLQSGVDEALKALMSNHSCAKILSDLRGTIIHELAEIHVANNQISDGISRHVHSVFFQYAANEGFHPTDIKTERLNDTYISLAKVEPENLVQFSKDFLERYTLDAILDALLVQLYLNVNTTIKSYTFDPTDPKKTKELTFEQGQELAEALSKDPLALSLRVSSYEMDLDEPSPFVRLNDRDTLKPMILNQLASQGFFQEDVLPVPNAKRRNESLHIIPKFPHLAYVTFEKVRHEMVRSDDDEVPVYEEKITQHAVALGEEVINALVTATTHYGHTLQQVLIYTAVNQNSPTLLHSLWQKGVNIMQALNASGDMALHLATKKSCLDVLKYFVCHLDILDSDINQLDSRGMTLLDWAEKYGQMNTIKYLLINQPDSRGMTLLDWAAKYGQMNAVKYLLNIGALIFEAEEQERAHSAFYWAAQSEQHYDIALFLLSQISIKELVKHDRINKKAIYQLLLFSIKQKKNADVWQLINQFEGQGLSWGVAVIEEALALKECEADTVTALIANALKHNRKLNQLLNILTDAVKGRPLAVCKALIDGLKGQGELINRAKLFELFYNAVCSGNDEVVEYFLLQRKVSNDFAYDKEKPLMPLTQAAKNGHIKVVRHLIQYHIYRAHELDTALYAAIRQGHAEIVISLLPYVNSVNFDLNTPFYAAFLTGNVAIVTAFLESKQTFPEIVQQSIPQRSFAANNLFIYIANPIITIVFFILIILQILFYSSLLLSLCSAPSRLADSLHKWAKAKMCKIKEIDAERDRIGQTPLALAILKSNEELVKVLILKGADVNQALLDGRTPLELAISTDSLSIVTLLIQNGATCCRKGKNGKTILDMAIEKGNPLIIQLIQDRTSHLIKPSVESVISSKPPVINTCFFNNPGSFKTKLVVPPTSTIFQKTDNNVKALSRKPVVSQDTCAESMAFLVEIR